MKWLLIVAAAAIGLPVAGQSSTTQGGSGNPDAARIEQRAQQMRDDIDSGGRRIQSHVRVAVRLKNGNKLIGVVKDGKLVERVDGLRFVDAQAKDRGAGVRLWYTSGARNYVFVPFADFVEYEVLAQLSSRQIEEIEAEMQMEERRRAERAAAAALAATGTADGAPVPADGVPPADAPKLSKAAEKAAERAAEAEKAMAAAKAASAADQEQRIWFALLQDYPPAAGWNQAKKDEISKRFVVTGVQPSEAEKKFVASFDEWSKACKHFGVDPAAKKTTEGEEPAEDEKGRGSRSKRDKK